MRSRRLEARVYETLLRELEAGSFVGEPPADPYARLAVAVSHFAHGRAVPARALTERVAGAAPPALARLIAARVLSLLGEHQRCLEECARAAADEPRLTGRALGLQLDVELRLGRGRDARRTVERLLTEEPGKLRWRVHALRLAVAAEDYEAALDHVDDVLAVEGRAAAMHLERANVLLALGRHEECVAAAEAAVRLERRRSTIVLEAARVCTVAGARAEARKMLCTARHGMGGDVRPRLCLAALALADGDTDLARREAAAVREVSPAHPALALLESGLASPHPSPPTLDAVLETCRGGETSAVHERRREADIAVVRSELRRAMGLGRASKMRTASGGAVEVPEALVEQFVRRGYVRLAGAVSAEVVAEWTRSATERVRSDPERWLENYDAMDPNRALPSFDPDDPTTWAQRRMVVRSSRRVGLAELSPVAFALASTLVGGAERLDRTTLSDYLVLNLRDVGPASGPALGHVSWHVDDPGRHDTLESNRRALLLFILLSDVAPGGGAPFIAPESIGVVARDLAASPGGVDYIDRDKGAAVSLECDERIELHGKAGDIFVVHPFMLHSGSGNPSGRIRWMATHMLGLNDALDLDGDSPLERSIATRLVARTDVSA